MSNTRLTKADRESIKWAIKVVEVGDFYAHGMHDPVVRAHVEKCRASVIVLKRILEDSKP